MKKIISVKSIWVIIYFLIASSLFSQGNDGTSLIKQKDGTLSLKYKDLQISIDPLTGGRITSLLIGENELLVTKEKNRFSYGSTFWPSPQVVWNWPPPSALDRGEYDVVESDSKIILKSKCDKKLGLQFTKEISISEIDTSVKICYSITNVSDKETVVSPWEITRMPKGGLVFFPQGLTEPKAKNFDPIPYNKTDNIFWYKSNKEAKQSNHLLSVADGSEGWLAYTNGNCVLIKKFDDIPPESQAANEGEIAVYFSLDAPIAEIEVEGPYTKIEPGKEIKWNMKWIARRIPDEITTEKFSNDLLRLVNSHTK